MGFAPQKRSDINLIRGDSYSLSLKLAMDLTNSTVFFTVKPTIANEATDATAIISVETTNHDNATNGETTITLSSTDTDVDPGTYYYDIQIKNGSTITSIPVRKLTVWGDVTRRTS